jgi:hypothetical protein
MNREALVEWVREALLAYPNGATIVQVAKHIWEHHKEELANSGDLFFTWQYDMRWAATKLRRAKKVRQVGDSQRGIWELVR